MPRTLHTIAFAFLVVLTACVSPSSPTRAPLPDLSTVRPDLHTPPMTEGLPAPGQRVRAVTTGWESTGVHHALYLPRDWRPGKRFPVLVEYAGNGGYTNAFGDISLGTVEGSNLGYGISGGRGFIWICMPFVASTNGVKINATKWWGDVDETIRYCRATVNEVCTRYGGDTNRVVLCGFSRGAIAGNFIGLHNDDIASLWCAFILHSHYDGVNTRWPYAGADRASALARLQRLRARPQFITHEGSTAAAESYLRETGVPSDFTFQPIPFRNHSDQWVLRDLPERRRLRIWLKRALK
ncbi:MAG: hypothetical protein AB1705_01055 [Verrucomicrobiota bacterium]